MSELKNEILDLNYIPVTEIDEEILPEKVILYLKNTTSNNQKIIIEPVSQEQIIFNNQNPSVTFNDNRGIFCLVPSIPCEGAINHVEIKNFLSFIENKTSFILEINGISQEIFLSPLTLEPQIPEDDLISDY